VRRRECMLQPASDSQLGNRMCLHGEVCSWKTPNDILSTTCAPGQQASRTRAGCKRLAVIACPGDRWQLVVSCPALLFRYFCDRRPVTPPMLRWHQRTGRGPGQLTRSRPRAALAGLTELGLLLASGLLAPVDGWTRWKLSNIGTATLA
jgi:hypothetical protein